MNVRRPSTMTRRARCAPTARARTALALEGYQLAINLFRRRLGEGELAPSAT
jgi:hypothetical protein